LQKESPHIASELKCRIEAQELYDMHCIKFLDRLDLLCAKHDTKSRTRCTDSSSNAHSTTLKNEDDDETDEEGEVVGDVSDNEEESEQIEHLANFIEEEPYLH
jgi:hypothetical protein